MSSKFNTERRTVVPKLLGKDIKGREVFSCPVCTKVSYDRNSSCDCCKTNFTYPVTCVFAGEVTGGLLRGLY